MFFRAGTPETVWYKNGASRRLRQMYSYILFNCFISNKTNVPKIITEVIDAINFQRIKLWAIPFVKKTNPESINIIRFKISTKIIFSFISNFFVNLTSFSCPQQASRDASNYSASCCSQGRDNAPSSSTR